MKQTVASVMSTLKWVVMGTVVFGEKVKIWDMMGMAPPAAYTWTQQNKIMACVGTFFSCNAIENALIQTGAFEVELNGMPIWSKLKSGRVPQGNELFQIIENQMQLHAPPDAQNYFPGSVRVGDQPHQSPDESEKENTEENEEEEENGGLGTNDDREEEEEEDGEEDEEEQEEKKDEPEDEFSEIDRETEDVAEDVAE